MAMKLYNEESIGSCANAIRSKTGESGTMTLAQMPTKISGIKTKEAVTWHQCPTAVRNYLDNVTYNPSDYTTSQIATYAPATAVVSNTKPIGKTVDGVTYYNEVPNVDTPFSSANTAGTVKPLDRLRWINSATGNMRDIGGWVCDGGTIRYGRIYRCAEINASDADLFVNQLGITMEIDLTADGTPAPFDGMEFVCAPTYAMYQITNNVPWKYNIRALFDAVKQGRNIVFHCSAGADRTGTFACIIEGLLGVSQNDCDKDYELTSFSSSYYPRARNGSYQGNPNQTWAKLMESIGNLTGATFMDKCVNFVASLGFTAEEINDFRSAMIDGTPATVTPSIETYTVTKSGSHVTFGNSESSVNQYQPYECEITPNSGYLIDSVTVTMNGVDVTDSYFSGIEVPYGVENITTNGEHDVAWKTKVNVNVPTGITPSGTKSITENGTYDVTQFAQAEVNVPHPTNFKQWNYTSTGTASGVVTTLVSGDDWIKQYYNNSDLTIIIKPKFTCAYGSGKRSILFATGSNSSFANTGGGYYSLHTRFTSDDGYAGVFVRKYKLTNPSDLGDIGATSSGNITLVTYSGASYMLQAGDWTITAFINS